MTSQLSSSPRSRSASGVSSSPDPVVELPARRSSSRRVLIRRSWVRSLNASMDPSRDEESCFLTARASRSPDRRAA